ncbi:MAG: hypothetical protein DWQ08_11820 [Proteobacteria bacterium]|nr:MAG: hypothetical protein DWQ08_11820 [Pseudomonadota bacterium]
MEGVSTMLAEHRSRLGPMSKGERLALFGFLLAALLWIGRDIISGLAPGLNLSDAGIAIGVSLLLFALPVDARHGVNVLNWEDAKKLPWGVLLLFGGGLSLAGAVDDTGLANHLGALLAQASELPSWALLTLSVAAIVFLTEVMSNTATTAAFLPVAAGLAVTLGEPPVALAVPVALAASCAFMLPAATPPNAMVFGSGRLAIHQMARAGFLFNLIAIVLISVLASTPLIGWLFV